MLNWWSRQGTRANCCVCGNARQPFSRLTRSQDPIRPESGNNGLKDTLSDGE